MNSIKRYVTILDPDSNEHMPSEDFLARLPLKLEQALRKAVVKIETSGDLSGPNTFSMGPGNWRHEVVNEENRWQQFFLKCQPSEAKPESGESSPQELRDQRKRCAQIGVFNIYNKEQLGAFFDQHFNPLEQTTYFKPLPAWSDVEPYFEAVLNDMRAGRETADYSYLPDGRVNIHIHREGIDFECFGRWL